MLLKYIGLGCCVASSPDPSTTTSMNAWIKTNYLSHLNLFYLVRRSSTLSAYSSCAWVCLSSAEPILVLVCNVGTIVDPVGHVLWPCPHAVDQYVCVCIWSAGRLHLDLQWFWYLGVFQMSIPCAAPYLFMYSHTVPSTTPAISSISTMMLTASMSWRLNSSTLYTSSSLFLISAELRPGLVTIAEVQQSA